MTIALAVVLFDLHISWTNAIGIILTLVGGVSLPPFASLLPSIGEANPGRLGTVSSNIEINVGASRNRKGHEEQF